MEKVIITAAITGSRMMRDIAPHIPITPEEIAQSAIESWQAGASIVHIHVRDPKTGLGRPGPGTLPPGRRQDPREDGSHSQPHHERHPREKPSHRGEARTASAEAGTGLL